VALINGCDKNTPYKNTAPTGEVHFDNAIGATSNVLPYYVSNSPTSTFNIEIGTTDVYTSDRTISYTITSPTGAVAGTHYAIVAPTGNTITIPAGSATAKITVHGIFAPYAAGTRKDTLVFTLATPGDLKVAGYSNVIKLVLQRYCDVDITAFTGTYIAQDYYNGAPDGGPYNVTLTPGTATGTTGFVTLTGLWGVPSPSLRINIDWTNPANFTTAVPTQLWFIDATYGQVTTRPNGVQTFSSCDNTFVIGYENTVAAGSFGKYITTLHK
jgi:hypothetical protein